MNYAKIIGCGIHGHIKVSEMALKIIDTPEFQRLRYIKQLGTTYFVYPGATHTRFEHSLGVYHLASKVTFKILCEYPDKLYNIPELSEYPIKLDTFICELINLGGLCHDIGHGPFSHIFDLFLETKLGQSNPNTSHEFRSCNIIEKIFSRELRLENKYIDFVKAVINPKKNNTGAIYQIVNNYLNGIDVDKFDYLTRDTHTLGLKKGFDHLRIIDELIIDSNNNIAYFKNCAYEIYNMFHTRYMMHKQVYHHKTSIIISSMMRDIFDKIDDEFQISKSVDDIDSFCKFTDYSIFSYIEMSVNPVFGRKISDSIMDAYKLQQDIVRRHLYKCVSEGANDSFEHFEKFISFLNSHDIDTSSLYIIKSKIGYVSGNHKNPFDFIYIYENKKTNNSFRAKKKDISNMLNDNYQELHCLLICKDREKFENIMNIYDIFISK